MLCIAYLTLLKLGDWFIKDDDFQRPKSFDEQLADERAARAHQEALARIRRYNEEAMTDAYVDEQFNNIQRRAAAEAAIKRFKQIPPQ
ncbi:hypothetical protein [Mycobacterium palustre]|uniref:Uncharacterized protein n=1 Tax=Mycobacterium palustre TaxID=153971 RepID=A0A1X1YYI2_9MYCO|nr:hypothetical protein [Mycobacterium palustre]MCV7101801.1 hypothetical protein [Mycobacterium palustre]ORW16031.1 hypothetical protein AWC19_23055 [Mycobacterium palustre]